MSAALFPSSNLYLLNAISQMGLVLFMFLVGLELNPKELYSHGEATVLVSHVSIAAPFVLRRSFLLSVSAAFRRFGEFHELRPVHGRRHGYHGFPRAGAYSGRSPITEVETGDYRDCMRRRGRRERVGAFLAYIVVLIARLTPRILSGLHWPGWPYSFS